MNIFGYFLQKVHFQGSSKKRAHRQKTLGGGGRADNPPAPPPPYSGRPDQSFSGYFMLNTLCLQIFDSAKKANKYMI